MKMEGAPMHPHDAYFHCGCDKCEVVWQRQLKAYNDYYKIVKEEKSDNDSL